MLNDNLSNTNFERAPGICDASLTLAKAPAHNTFHQNFKKNSFKKTLAKVLFLRTLAKGTFKKERANVSLG